MLIWFHVFPLLPYASASFLAPRPRLRTWAAGQHTQHQQSTQKDQAGYNRQEPDIGILSSQVKIQGNRQQPELDAHQQDTYGESRKHGSDLTRRWGAFNIASCFAQNRTCVIHCGISCSANTIIPSWLSVMLGSDRCGGPASGAPVRGSNTPS